MLFLFIFNLTQPCFFLSSRANEEGTSTIHCIPLIPRPGLSTRYSSLHFESPPPTLIPANYPHQKYHQQKVLRPPTRKKHLIAQQSRKAFQNRRTSDGL
ncbi:hypothetical protein CEXT_172391 [Caerostris extrusa]|uniref:Secreted protein n=1 Tax=Caerostris extrusa TaxID=172846 RepID=A0AAV4XJJ4_CAEEX|nr:hypothetical protein CEXT_172391 [Caerostris extrusa]